MSGVLIVDDSLTVRMDLQENLEAAGLEASSCATLGAARTLLAQRRYALVILDVLLPDGDGIELLSEIRESPAGSSTVVMLLSTESDVRDRIRGLTTGADEYIGKPYEASYVVARARQLLRHGDAAAAAAEQTVLVVDDSITFREMLREAIEAAGYGVITAVSGEEGLRLAADRRPSALVIDGVLPGIDGPTVIRRMRLDAALRRIPCLLLTASEGHNSEIQALEAGADAFVRKDEDIGVIVARLGAILRGAGERSDGGEGTASLLAPKKILAVDDSETHLQALAEALRGEGYEVVLARSGEEALDLLAVQPVDCILLDLQMPGIGGQETCRRIKAASSLRDTPVVMLTAREDRDGIIEGLAAGADDYISKSSDFQVLRARVLAQIRRRQFEDENRLFREQMLRKEIEAAEARAARELAETRAALVDELERKNEELFAANQAKDAFLATMSHEFRTPLNAIIGFTGVLLMKLPGPLTAEQEKQLRTVRRSADHLLALINDLLDLAKIGAGKVSLAREPTVLQDILREIESTARPAAESKRLAFDLAAPDSDLVVPSDRRALSQILLNLTSNAIKFTKRGSVCVSLALAEADGRMVAELTVVDTGIGIRAEDREKLFQPFMRLSSAGEPVDIEGTGLGLHLSQKLAEILGGRIFCRSVFGEGSTFTLQVPAE